MMKGWKKKFSLFGFCNKNNKYFIEKFLVEGKRSIWFAKVWWANNNGIWQVSEPHWEKHSKNIDFLGQFLTKTLKTLKIKIVDPWFKIGPQKFLSGLRVGHPWYMRNLWGIIFYFSGVNRIILSSSKNYS
jgi:hypothetical protein